MCPARARRRRRRQGLQAVVQREPARLLARRRSRPCARSPASSNSIPTARRRRLREAIAEAHGLNPANIVCSNGSDELLGLLAQTYLAPGDEAIFTEHGFLVYKIYIQAAGARPGRRSRRPTSAPMSMRSWPRSRAKTKIVFLANPNNPTGTYLPFEEIRRLHAGLPKHVLLVLDAAYAEYVRRNDYEAGIELVSAARRTSS